MPRKNRVQKAPQQKVIEFYDEESSNRSALNEEEKSSQPMLQSVRGPQDNTTTPGAQVNTSSLALIQDDDDEMAFEQKKEEELYRDMLSNPSTDSLNKDTNSQRKRNKSGGTIKSANTNSTKSPKKGIQTPRDILNNSSNFLPQIAEKPLKLNQQQTLMEMNHTEAEADEALDQVETVTIQRTKNRYKNEVNKSEVTDDLVQQARPQIRKQNIVKDETILGTKVLTEADLHEAEMFNTKPRDELGGRVSLSDLNQLASKEISSIIKNAATLQSLKTLNRINLGKNEEDYSDEDLGSLSLRQREIQKSEDNELDFDPGAKNQDMNKRIFINKFGVKTELPTFYVLDAKIYPKNVNYILKVIKYSIPNQRQRVNNFEVDKDPVETSMSELFKDGKYHQQNVVLELIKVCRESQAQVTIKQVSIHNAFNVNIAFSPNGEYFSLFRKKLNILQIYKIDDHDIAGLMDKVHDGKSIKKFESLTPFKNAQKMYFDRKDRFLVSYGKEIVNIIPLDETEKNDTFQSYIIDKKKLTRIINLQFVSQSQTEFRCEVACSVKDKKVIKIWNITQEGQQIDQERSLCYLADELSSIQIKISEDFESMIFLTCSEKYSFMKESQGYCQRVITSLKSRHIDFIHIESNQFFLFCSRHFDKSIKVMTTFDHDFLIRIPRQIEPHSQKIFDVMQTDIINGFGAQMIVASQNGETFYVDVLSPQNELKTMAKNEEIFMLGDAKIKIHDQFNTEGTDAYGSVQIQRQISGESNQSRPKSGLRRKSKQDIVRRLDSYIDDGSLQFSLQSNPLQAMYLTWPYACLGYGSSHFWLFCAYRSNILNRIELPKQEGDYTIAKVNITFSLDLYLILQSNTQRKYQIWRYELNQDSGDILAKKISNEKCFEYSYDQVQNKKLIDIKFRSESKKTDQIQNLKLVVLILHEGSVYTWIKGYDNSFVKISDCHSTQLTQKSQNEFIFRNDKFQDDGTQVFNLKLVNIMFSFYEVVNFYSEKVPVNVFLKAYAYDYGHNYLVLMYKSGISKNEKIRKLKIFNIHEQKVMIQIDIKDQRFIGRIRSNNFKFVNGHFYFCNQVYKIRYDLLGTSMTKDLREGQLIDYYSDLLGIRAGEKIHSDSPMICQNYNKLSYITSNKRFLFPMRLVLMPFLHERKIYLGKSKPGYKYFYNVVEEDFLSSIASKIMNVYTKKQGKIKMIFNLCPQSECYYVYNILGILLKKISYKEQAVKYGKPIQVSENGRNLIFQNEEDQYTIHILCMNSTQLMYIKTINIKESIDEYLNDLQNETVLGTEDYSMVQRQKADIKGEFQSLFIQANAVLTFSINDNLDVTVQISNLIEKELNEELSNIFDAEDIPALITLYRLKYELGQITKRQRIADPLATIKLETQIGIQTAQLSTNTKRQLSQISKDLHQSLVKYALSIKGSLFYVQRGYHGVDFSKQTMLQSQYVQKTISNRDSDNQALFFSKDYEQFKIGQEIGNFTSNKKFVIFWNASRVFYLDLQQVQATVRMKLQNFTFHVDPNEKLSFIRRIRAGSNPNMINIIVQQSKRSQCIIQWDLAKDVEVDSFDQGINSKLFYDSKGDSYITENNTVTMQDQNVLITSYDVTKVNNQAIKKVDTYFDYYKGHRVDGQNHNWILFNEYLSLSFSFMTFVIRGRSQESNSYLDENYIFDQAEYDFIINKRTCFTCDEFVGRDFEKLSYVLKKMKEVNPVLLDQLHYYYEIDHSKDKTNDADQFEKDGRRQSIIGNVASISKSVIRVIIDEEQENNTIQKVCPLHLAYNEGNNRSINILLKYMSMLDRNCCETIKDILPQLLEYENFILYMRELPFQTIQMLNKQTLKLPKKFSDDIVSLNRHSTSYIDDQYFRERVLEQKENKSYKNFPVSVWALKVDWILNSNDGKELLQAILNSENHDLFECEPIVCIVEFLFKHYRKVVLQWRLPFYLVQLGVFFLAVLLNEQIYAINHDSQMKIALTELLTEQDRLGELEKWQNQLDFSKLQEPFELDETKVSRFQNVFTILVSITNLFLTFYSMAMVIIQGRASFVTFFSSVWAYFDIFYVLTNGFVSFAFLYGSVIDIKYQRGIEAFLSMIIVVKLVYYTQLMDEIAPLVNIIIQVFKDIFWFMLLFVISIFCFAVSFYLMGQNQIYDIYMNEIKAQLELLIDGKQINIDYTEEEVSTPSYETWSGALHHIYLLGLGDFQTDDYELGEGRSTAILWLFFIIASFLLLIHLLNMLIAIMGETFAQNNEIKKKAQIRNHLRFVLDNSWMQPIVEKEKITYLITSYLSQEDNHESEVIKEIHDNIMAMQIRQIKDTENIMSEMTSIKNQVNVLSQND